MSDFYQILGVSKDSDPATIKKAYRKMAMKYHPDQNPGDQEAEEKFKEAARAYEVLSDPEKRSRYDRFGEAGLNGFGGGGAGGFQDVGDIFSAFGDIFGDFFGGGARGARGRNRPRRGSDLRYYLEIDLEDAVHGADRQIEFDAEDVCNDCEGSGAQKGSRPETCAHCGGNGQVVRSQGFFQMATTCPVCQGRGEIIKDPCKTCNGQTRVIRRRKIDVKVPAGVDSGNQLRLSGEGERGHLGGPPGDLFAEIRVKPHARFERREMDLVGRLEISYLQALLGAEIETETLRGARKVKVPAGSQPGEPLVLSGEGVKSLRSGRTGDLLLELQVVIPKKLKKKEEELLRQLAKESGEAVLEAKSGIFGW